MRTCILAACLVYVSGCATSLPRPRLCDGATGCAADQVCLASRCEPLGRSIVNEESVRVMLAPSKLAVAASGGGSGASEVVTLGRRGAGEVILLLGFAPPFRDDATVERAYLWLTPAAVGPPPRQVTVIELARVLSPWEAAETSWTRQPRLSRAVPVATIPPTLRGPVRIDVTSLVRAWRAEPHGGRDFALIAEGDDPRGYAVAMGLTTGVGPRLEVYLR